MAECKIQTRVNASQERVFDVFADLANSATRLSGLSCVDILTQGPVGVGTRWRETRVLFGKAATEEMEITAFDRPNGYSVKAESHGALYTSHFHFAEETGGVRVTTVFKAEPQTFTAKVLTMLMSSMMMSSVRKALEQDMADLKAFIEGEHSAA
ncbi:MAG: SRPBCC family protein [Pseudomonadota bacterium]